MQRCADAVMMLLHRVKVDGGEKLGWEDGSTMRVAVWFTHKERSPVPSPQTQQKQTTCRQPVSPPAPVCVPSSPRNPLPLLPVQLSAPSLGDFCHVRTKCSPCPIPQIPPRVLSV